MECQDALRLGEFSKNEKCGQQGVPARTLSTAQDHARDLQRISQQEQKASRMHEEASKKHRKRKGAAPGKSGEHIA